ncbi:MAG: hypothetical protein ACXW3Z_10940 [Limisphaerales bacterium]
MRSLLSILLIFAFTAAARGTDTPDVEEILRKLVEQSEDPEIVKRRNYIAYERISRVEHLNDDGTQKRDTVRVFKIAPEDGKPITRLISINGRPAATKQDKKRSAARETGEKGRTLALSEDLISRFDFTFVREEEFASRPALVLSFVPKSNVPNDSFMDRLINSMSGTFWVDKAEHQLSKAEIRLSKRVAFFGGIAGAIDKIDLVLIQRRIEPSIWLGEAVHLDFVGRKLLSDIRFRCFENCADFRVVPEQHASAK